MMKITHRNTKKIPKTIKSSNYLKIDNPKKKDGRNNINRNVFPVFIIHKGILFFQCTHFV